MRIRLSVSYLLAASVLVSALTASSATQSQTPNASPSHSAAVRPTTAPHALPVSEATGWRVFLEMHEALATGSDRDAYNDLLSALGISEAVSTVLRSRGAAYLATLNEADARVRSDVLDIYGVPMPNNVQRARSAAPRPSRAVRLPPTASLREDLVRRGVLAKLDADRNVALASLLAQLREDLGATQVDSVRAWVNQNVLPGVSTHDGAGPSSGATVPSTNGQIEMKASGAWAPLRRK